MTPYEVGISRYDNYSFCGHCGEWKKKGERCEECGLMMRNKARNKRKPNKK